MKAGRMRALRVLVVSALAASLWATVPTSAVAVEKAAGLAGVDPVPPRVPDPVPVTTMACGPDQVDVSSASAEVLSATFGLEPAVAARVVEGRQPFYLTLDDLKYVAGIGPDELAAIVAGGRACTLPPTTPPPVDGHACLVGSGQLDMNRPASHYAELVDLYGRPTADRIVANAPYAGLAHVVAESVAGSGKGKHRKNAERLCLTPATVAVGDTTYGWMPSAGGVVTHTTPAGDRYRLTVPPGVVEGTGIYGSTGPVDADAFVDGLNANNAHLWGPWNGVVFVGSPPDPETDLLGDGWANVVLHFPEGTSLADPDPSRATIQHSSGIAVVDGLVTAPTQELSLFLVIAIPAAAILSAAVTYQPWTPWLSDLFRGLLGAGASHPDCSPDITDQTRPDGTLIATSGKPVEGVNEWQRLVRHCVTDLEGEPKQAQWGLANNTGVVVPLTETPGVEIDSVSWNGNIMQMLFFGVINATNQNPGLNARPMLMYPGSTARVRIQQAYSPQVLNYGPDSGALSDFAFSLLFHTLGLTDLSKVGASVAGELANDCGPVIKQLFDVVMASDYSAAGVGAVTSIIASCIDDATEARALSLRNTIYGEDNRFRGAKRFNANLRRLMWIQAAAVGSVAGLDYLRVREARGPIEMTFRGRPPAQPIQGPSDPDVSSIPPDGYLIKIPGAPTSYYVTNRVAHHVPNGGTYDCLADRVPTRYEVGPALFDELVDAVSSRDASCPAGVEHLVVAAIGAWADEEQTKRRYEGYLVRLDDGQGYEIRNGLLEPIVSDGNVFECLARTRWTWDRAGTAEDLYNAGLVKNSWQLIMGCNYDGPLQGSS